MLGPFAIWWCSRAALRWACYHIGSYHCIVDASARERRYNGDMTASQFRTWLKLMGISGAEAARQLGVKPNTVTRYRRKGGPKMLALACRALFHRLGDLE